MAAKPEQQLKPGRGPRKGGSYIKDEKTGIETLKTRTATPPAAQAQAKAEAAETTQE